MFSTFQQGGGDAGDGRRVDRRLLHGLHGRVGRGRVIGGGPIESFRRLVTQDNMMSDMLCGLTTDVIKLTARCSTGAAGRRHAAASVRRVSARFRRRANIPPDFIFTRTPRRWPTLAPLFVIGYLFARNRGRPMSSQRALPEDRLYRGDWPADPTARARRARTGRGESSRNSAPPKD